MPRLVRDITLFRRPGESQAYRRSEERHVQAIYEARWLEEELVAAGFAVTTSKHYGSHALGTRRLAFIASGG